jgi:hypothetical protein
MREMHGLSVFESRVMEDIWCKRDKVTANMGRLHGKELITFTPHQTIYK